MPIPNYNELTENEWYMIFLLERIRHQSIASIAEWIGCTVYRLTPHWDKFRNETGPAYLDYKRAGNTKEQIYMYMDAAAQQDLVLLRAEVLADLLGCTPSEVKEYQDEWYNETSTRARWIMCTRCNVRGSTSNPILENRRCLECNAEENNWPLEHWKNNGQYTALLHSWGLMDNVAWYIKGDNGNSRHGAEIHQAAEREELVGKGALR